MVRSHPNRNPHTTTHNHTQPHTTTLSTFVWFQCLIHPPICRAFCSHRGVSAPLCPRRGRYAQLPLLRMAFAHRRHCSASQPLNHSCTRLSFNHPIVSLQTTRSSPPSRYEASSAPMPSATPPFLQTTLPSLLTRPSFILVFTGECRQVNTNLKPVFPNPCVYPASPLSHSCVPLLPSMSSTSGSRWGKSASCPRVSLVSAPLKIQHRDK